MASITCPKCKKRISEFDLVCFSCGCTITEEERARQLMELEKQRSTDSLKGSSVKERALKHQKKQRMLIKLNRISFGFFRIGWAGLIVPLLIVLLILIVIVLMTI